MKRLVGIIGIVFLVLFFTISNNNYSNRVVSYNGNKFRVSIDGVASNSLPTSGNYYLTRYKCGSSVTKVSWDNSSHSLSISNGGKEGGIACNLTFESSPRLSSMKSGSYVKYVGNNGCSGNSCEGVNANYVSDSDMGYCYSEANKYLVSGFRLFYVSEDTAYLVSAGALECVKKSSDSTNALLYINELNSRALAYCNKEYVYGGTCDNSSVRSINESDITKYLDMDIFDCLNNSSNRFCGYNNDLIDNGGNYLYAADYSFDMFMWDARERGISNSSDSNKYGLRPVIRISADKYVVGGQGTYKDPYVLSASK